MENIILFGAGGHAHSVVDSIEHTQKYNIIGFLDTKEMQGKSYRGYPVLDTDDAMEKYYDNGVRNAFITIGYMGRTSIRNKLYEKIKTIGYSIPNIIDHTAIVAENVILNDGIFVGKGVVINAGSKIEEMCIINTRAIVEHDCRIGAFSHIAVGSVLCGGVSVGTQTFIGANATVIQNVEIGNNVIVGAGAIIHKNIKDNRIRYGTIEKQNTEVQ